MRTLVTTIIGGLMLLVGIAYLADWRPMMDIFWPRPEKYALMPGPVAGSRAAGITANFTLVQERLLDPGEQGQRPVAFPSGAIETNREGGACLVFSADDLGFAQPGSPNCENDAGCALPGASFGYCAPVERRCWVKPAALPATMCRKSRVESFKLETGVVYRAPKDGTLSLGALNLPADRTVRARLITCLETTDGTGETGCPVRGVERRDRWGPATPL